MAGQHRCILPKIKRWHKTQVLVICADFLCQKMYYAKEVGFVDTVWTWKEFYR